jgi:uncharacterized protein YkwD
MTKKIILTFLFMMLSVSCVKVAGETPTSTPVVFVTSTLPPTKPGLRLPTETPLAATPTPDPLTPNATPACRDGAVFVEDVTYPDHTRLKAGEKFTKTWKLQNIGTCTWTGYTVTFVSGDKMESPDSASVPQTEAGQTVDISVELIAPSMDGSYTGYFELKNANGETLPIGIERAFWVKILIGNIAPAPVSTLPASTSVGGVPTVKVTGPASCDYSTSASYANEIASLINNARLQNGLPALSVNAQLTAAAQGHSIDMACHGLTSHSGSNGSTVHQRVAAAGYSASRSSEIIYSSGYPQTAFDWWMSDQIHRNEILNPNVTEMGVGYAYTASSAYGGYYTVDFASP